MIFNNTQIRKNMKDFSLLIQFLRIGVIRK